MQKIKKNTVNIILKILFTLICIFPLLDSLNGFLLKNNIFTMLGQMTRGGFIILLFSLVLLNFNFQKLKGNIITCMIAICMCAISLLMAYLFKSEYYNEISIMVTIKFLSFIFMIEGLLCLVKLHVIEKGFLESIFDINSLLVPLVIIIPYLFGVGFTIYADGTGFKGFYFSNNELNFVLILLLYFKYNQFLKNRSVFKLIVVFLILFCCFLLNSKSSLILCVLIIVCLPIILHLKGQVKLSKRLIFSFIILMVIGGGILSVLMRDSIYEFINRQLYFLRNKSFIEYFTSSRTLIVENSWNKLIDNSNVLFRLIFGNGGLKDINDVSPTEMDFIDTFFYYGMIGVGFITVYFTKILVKIKKDYNNVMFLYILLLVYAFWTGHVFFYGISGSYFALMIAYSVSKEKNAIMLTSSTGGHFEQIKQLFYLKNKHQLILLTEKNKISKIEKNIKIHYLYQQERKNIDFIFKFIANIWNSFYYISIERPKVIISTGAGCTIFPCLFTKLLGGKVIYIESFAKVDSKTKSGKIVYKFADKFYVQWEDMLRLYPKAIFKGGIYK